MHRPKLQKPLHYSAPGGRTQSGNHVPFTNLSPQTPAEQYWASRALKAEALLSAREKHFEEVGKVREEEQAKRRDEILSLETRYKEKYNNLERLVTVLVLAMTFLLVLLTYAVVSRHNTNPFNTPNAPGFPFLSFLWGWSGSSYLNKKESASSRFNFHLHLPSHFTVPILSPWTSVVEHQTSNITGPSASSNFYSILIISLLFIGVSSIIIWKYNRGLLGNFDSKKDVDSQRLLPSSGVLQLLGNILSPGVSSIAFWAWAWNWSCKLLRLFGFAPR